MLSELLISSQNYWAIFLFHDNRWPPVRIWDRPPMKNMIRQEKKDTKEKNMLRYKYRFRGTNTTTATQWSLTLCLKRRLNSNKRRGNFLNCTRPRLDWACVKQLMQKKVFMFYSQAC